MFFYIDIGGRELPHHTLCLTYDDGPGRAEGSPAEPGPRTDAV